MAGPDRDQQVEAFVQERSTELMRAAMALTGNVADAQDLVQLTCLQLWRSWGRVRSANDPVAYSHRVLINAHISERRRRHWQRERLTAEVPERAHGVDLAAIEAADGIRAALDGLPPRQRAAVVLRYLLDLDDRAVAAAMGCSVPTVRSQISRALTRLRQHSPDLEVSDGA